MNVSIVKVQELAPMAKMVRHALHVQNVMSYLSGGYEINTAYSAVLVGALEWQSP